MKRRKINWKAVAFLAALAAVFIGYGIWHDLHPPARTGVAGDRIEVIYLIDDAAGLARLPKDYRGVLLDLRKGNLSPQDIEGRTVDILLPLPPADKAYFVIRQVLDDWENAGNRVTEVFFDIPKEPENAEDLDAVLSGLRKKTSNKYFFSTALKSAYLEKMPKSPIAYANILKHGRAALFDAAEAANPGETILQTAVRLEKYKIPFMLRVTGTPDIRKVMESSGAPLYFNGFIIDPPGPEKKKQSKSDDTQDRR